MTRPTFLLALAAVLTLPRFSSAADFAINETPGKYIDILQDGKIAGRYMIEHDTSTPDKRNETYKPYLHVFDAEGKAPITKGPGGEYTHHRGILLGWMKIGVNGKTYDRWHMKGGDQVHEKLLAQDAAKGSITSLVKWMGEGTDVILEEERTMAFLPATAPAYAVVDVTSKLKAVAGDTMIDGDPEHAGLQFRPANEVDRSKGTYLFPKENADPHKDLDYPWFAQTFSLNNQDYSVVYLNHPGNPQGARISAYRDYGRFGAFFKTALKKDEVLTLKVRFLIVKGAMPEVAVIQKAWNDYTGKNDPLPKTTVRPAEKKAEPKKAKSPKK